MFPLKTLVGAAAIACSLFETSTATATQWESVVRNADEALYVDLDSLRMVDGHVEAQALHTYSKARTLGQDWYAHRSRVMTYRFDCNGEKLAFTAFEMRSGELGSGETVIAGTTGGYMFPAASDPLDDKLMGKVCSPANLTRAERHGGDAGRLASR